jgi:transcriptional regulator with XRE-family HTH domain
MTQEDLAFTANITVSPLSRIERGLSNPTWTTILRITTALDVTLAELVATIEGRTPRHNTPRAACLPVSACTRVRE